jgi:peptide/nickel transport system substrate-binding protein
MSGQRRSLIAAAVSVVLALTAAACTGSSTGGDSGGPTKTGGTLRIGSSSGIASINPFVGFNQDDFASWMYMYPSLLQYDTTSPNMNYISNFADTWSQSSDGLTVTFHTVPNAKWSDGEALTADDVAWTINVIKKYADGPAGNWAGSVKFLRSIAAPDTNTVVATYNQPSATYEFDLGLVPILPPQVWEKYATGDGKGLKTFPNEPQGEQPLTGGGPFLLTEYRKDDIALFEANPSWYGPKPNIDGFGLQFYRDEDAMITALKTDQIDAINEIPPTSVATLKDAGMHVYEGQALAERNLIFNMNPDKADHHELLNPQVREAFEYAIDRNEIVQTAWLGYATPGTTIVPAGNATGGVDWHDSSIQPLPFDPNKANEILEALGYAKGSDGIRVANGEPMSYDVVFPQDEEGAGDRAFQIIQHGLDQIGVKVIQKKLDDNAAWDAIYCGGNCQYRDFDLAMWDWFPAADPDFVLSVLTCDQWGSWSDSAYCNDEYDKLYAQQKSTVDPNDRQHIIFQMQQMVFDDRPYIILTYDRRLDAWSPKWEGFIESTQGIFNAFSTQSLISVHQA